MLLNCHTQYSFGYGILTVEELLAEVKARGHQRFVLSDINNTSAVLDTLRLATDAKVQAIPGIDFRNGIEQKYVGIAQNNEGFRELNEHLTQHLHTQQPFKDRAPAFQHCFVVYPMQHYRGHTLLPHERIGVSLNDLLRLPFSPLRHLSDRLVALQSATFLEPLHHRMHRLLRAIHRNDLLSKLPQNEQAHPNDLLLQRHTLEQHYAAYPFIQRNTEHILDHCEVRFGFGKFAGKNLTHYTDSVAGDIELLRNECYKALPYRYGDTPADEVLQRLEKELQIIGQMNFASYYLVNWDIVQYAQRKDYYYIGRGSGANSLAAYLLRITDVDPIDLDLYFERFINPFRTNPPDFDIDFSWTDRDDITRYIFERFGQTRTALLGAYNTFQHDAVIRELGKVFGLPAGEIDSLQARGSSKDDTLGKLVMAYGKRLEGFPSHLSIHSSGILIAQEPIACYSATFLPPKGYPTTQFSMLEAEDIGLYKLDILSQRGLAKIKDTVTLVHAQRGIVIDIHNIRRIKQDERVKQLLAAGRCIGCFYIESPAMRMLLAKLRADDYLRLVAASSIIRPGVSQSGMMREYILRYRHEHLRKQARDAMPERYDILSETYGVMVYQEDVIRVAHFFAGLTLAEADYLRRGMSWKFRQRNEFSRVRENFFLNCRSKGYPEAAILETWTQIESFANYAFAKGHSASYAIESMQALYLKAYHPLEYLVATLNNGGGFYRAEIYLHEARMHGAQIEAPCVNKSMQGYTLHGRTIYLGLGQIAELEQRTIADIVLERNREGPYKDLENLVRRISISIDQLRLLIRACTLRFTKKSKQELLWEAHALLSQQRKSTPTQNLFELRATRYTLPTLNSSAVDEAMDEKELFGYTLLSPFDLLRESADKPLLAADLKQRIGQIVEIVGYLITIKPTRTVKGQRMFFGTFLDQAGDWIDTVHFPPAAAAHPMRGRGCYRLIGKVAEEFDFVSIEIREAYRLDDKNRDDGPTANVIHPKK